MKRSILLILSVLSLGICLLDLATWARSYWIWDDFFHSRPSRSQAITSAQGRWLILLESPDAADLPRQPWTWTTRPSQKLTDLTWWWLGFWYHTGDWAGRTGRQHEIALAVPHWAVACVTAVPPVCWILGVTRTGRRKRFGLCSSCGYDLTGNVSGVCPECGAVIPANGDSPSRP